MRRLRWSIILSLLLGALANLAMAWHCLYWQQGPRNPASGLTAQQMWDRYAYPNPQFGPARREHTSGALGCDFFILACDMSVPPQIGPPRMMITRAGFPFRAFEAMHGWGDTQPTQSGGIRITPFNPNVAWLSMLPLRPLAAGLVLNTLFYAALTWLILFGPFALVARTRRRLRLLQSHCPECGYDLRGDLAGGCPECGWRRGAEVANRG